MVNFINESINEVTNHWTFGDPHSGIDNSSGEHDPWHIYSNVGTYEVWLVIENEYGCRDSVSRQIFVEDIWTFYAANAFTPNGDGTNDLFIPQSTNLDYSTFEFYIYDRWGENIYYTTDINSPWDGRAKDGDKIVQQEVYTWVVRVSETSGRRHEYIGHVTVIK
jgi:gliding motility-associated-like protein